jgi:2-oxoglutarate ferredoxin oxidoreductase subunit delta
MGTIIIDSERCKGCGLCVLVCPQKVIGLNEDLFNARGYHPAELREESAVCTGCAVCAVICPDVCISVYRATLKQHHTEEMEVG